MSEEADRKQSMIKFGRDVCVNVLANLIAVPILYLLGVLGGLFPRDPRAIAVALFLIVFASCVLLVIVSWFVQGVTQERILMAAFFLVGVGFLIVGLANIDLGANLPRWLIIATGCIGMLGGLFALRDRRNPRD